jgi:phage baseplate assembly protein gpV
MPLNTTLEGAQQNFYQLLNQLDSSYVDKVNIYDNNQLLAVMVTWLIYQAADPSGSSGVIEDVAAAYSGSPVVYSAPLYRLTKKMRDREISKLEAQKATGSITATTGALTVDGETFTITNAAAVAKVFEFDSGGGVGVGNIAVPFTGAETAAQMAGLIQAAISGAAGFGVVADAPVVATVGLTQSDPGAGANYAIASTVADVNFVVAGFIGGQDASVAAGVIGIKMSKNDPYYRAALVPADHAVAIGL